jgi:hypothetical protein
MPGIEAPADAVRSVAREHLLGDLEVIVKLPV